MKILLVGNSQLSCIKLAFDMDKNSFGNNEVNFYVFPGGWGPAFEVHDNKLKVIESAVVPEFPPRVYPNEVYDTPLDSYDAIIVGALGYLDGGFYYTKPTSAILQGLIVEFGPKKNNFTDRLLSKSIYTKIIASHFENHQTGFKFLRTLRKNYKGKIILQPFPLLSEIVRDHPKWGLREMYTDPIGAHRFFTGIRDEFLRNICSELNVDLLPYPDPSWHTSLFTPGVLMQEKDGLHPHASYGHMVIKQILEEIIKE